MSYKRDPDIIKWEENNLNNLYRLRIGESIEVSKYPSIFAKRVPGGWIYHHDNLEAKSWAVFVPWIGRELVEAQLDSKE